MLNKGIEFFNKGKYNDAIKIFNNCIKNPSLLNDKERSVYFLRGKSYALQKKYLLAFNDMKYHLCVNPTDTKCYLYLCEYIIRGILSNHEKHFKLDIGWNLTYFYIATSLFPKIDMLYYMQCIYILYYENVFERKGIFDPYVEILRLITQAINLDKGNYEFYRMRGITHVILEEYDKGLNDLLHSNKLLERTGVKHIEYLRIAKCYLMKKQFLLFNKYLSIATNCKCCNHDSNLKRELNLKKIELINQWKSQIFQKNLKKW